MFTITIAIHHIHKKKQIGKLNVQFDIQSSSLSLQIHQKCKTEILIPNSLSGNPRTVKGGNSQKVTSKSNFFFSFGWVKIQKKLKERRYGKERRPESDVHRLGRRVSVGSWRECRDERGSWRWCRRWSTWCDPLHPDASPPISSSSPSSNFTVQTNNGDSIELNYTRKKINYKCCVGGWNFYDTK